MIEGRTRRLEPVVGAAATVAEGATARAAQEPESSTVAALHESVPDDTARSGLRVRGALGEGAATKRGGGAARHGRDSGRGGPKEGGWTRGTPLPLQAVLRTDVVPAPPTVRRPSACYWVHEPWDASKAGGCESSSPSFPDPLGNYTGALRGVMWQLIEQEKVRIHGERRVIKRIPAANSEGNIKSWRTQRPEGARVRGKIPIPRH